MTGGEEMVLSEHGLPDLQHLLKYMAYSQVEELGSNPQTQVKLGTAAHICNPSVSTERQQAETGECPELWGQIVWDTVFK